ncbi:MAG: SDR family NAD(P)-dependent oxidoreductase [Planctomycetes bacterium]|nr:SDR family NAD(P)-dependent oxidoreductase [Planctomycetota bacterium]
MTPNLAIVTGSSRGIGRAITSALLARGYDVVGVARTAPADLDHERYSHFACDLADLDAVARTFEAEVPKSVPFAGRARIALVNNAGILEIASVPAAQLERLDASLRVNTVVPMYLHGWLCRTAPAAARLRVVDISSGAADSPYPGWSAYCASKAALDMAGRVLAEERDEVAALQGRDLAVVSYAPGVVATDMQAQIRAADDGQFPRRQRFVDLHQQGELVDPAGPADEIAGLIERDDLPPFSRSRFAG